jgi:alpha-galactosidase-like protein
VRRALLLLATLTLPTAARAGAQQVRVARAAPQAAREGDSVGAAARAVAPAAATPSLPVRAAPRTIQVFMVPVPLQLRSDRPVAFVVVPTGDATILPPLQGMLPAGGGPVRSVTVVASVPAGARAGARRIAEVRFSQQGADAAAVPLELEVSQVRGAALRLTQQLFGARPGERVVMHFLLTNTGNAPDTLDLTVALPADWSPNVEPKRYVLARGQTASGDVIVSVPNRALSGAFRVRLSAFSGRSDVADADAVIELFQAPGGRATLGPRLVAGVATVLAPGEPAAPVFGFELSGPLTDHLQAFGRLIQPTNGGSADQRDLPRVGYFVGAPFLTLVAPTWQFTGGATGHSFSDVTGTSAYGRGASFSWSDSQATLAALAAVPAPVGEGTGSGHLLGLRVGTALGRPGGQLSATVTDLEDPQFGGRRLQAVGVGAVSPPFAGVTVSGELAERRFSAGEGLGWMTDLTRQTRQDFGELRFIHAPGGSTAFARARDEFSAVGSRGFGGRLTVGAGVWSSDDDNTTFSRLHTSGWSLAPRFDLTAHTSLELEARASGFEAQSAAGLLGNGETVVRLGVTTQRGAMYLSGSGSVGSASQKASLPGGPLIETSAGRQSVRAVGGVAAERGTVELSGSFEHNGAGVGFLPLQYVVGVRLTRVALSSAPGTPLLSVGVQRYGWFGDRPDVTVARVGVEALLPGDLALTVDAERNPFLTSLTGGARWIPVVKLERGVRVPVGALEPAAKGIVYQDLNGNGVRDRGEPPVAGAVVRRGSETVITDRSGRFRFYERTEAPVRLDETSLPFGLIANPARPAERQPLQQVEIGLIPTTAVDVQLVPTADSTGRLPRVDLTGVGVQAVDTAGNVWTARADSGGRARFYALPPGHYRLQADFSGLREPVRLQGPAPSFIVAPGRAVPLLTIPVYPRPIRIFDPGNRGSSARSPGQ